MQHRLVAEFGGTAILCKKEPNIFYVAAYQQLENFEDWNYVATPSEKETQILVRVAIDPKRFRGPGDPNAPPERSHVFVRGYFDDYTVDKVTKHLTILTIIVESYELLCDRPCIPPTSITPAPSPSLAEDREDWTPVGSDIDLCSDSPCPSQYVI